MVRVGMSTCWLCGEITRHEESLKCSDTLVSSTDSVAGLVVKFGIKNGSVSVSGDEGIVCSLCMTLVVKIDRSSFELDSYVDELKSRVDGGEFFDNLGQVLIVAKPVGSARSSFVTEQDTKPEVVIGEPAALSSGRELLENSSPITRRLRVSVRRLRSQQVARAGTRSRDSIPRRAKHGEYLKRFKTHKTYGIPTNTQN